MAENLTVQIATPECEVFKGEMSEIRVPGIQGEFGVLPGHIPFMTSLGVGSMTCIPENGSPVVYATAHGVAEVSEDTVRVLCKTCERADGIDLDRAKAAREKAEKALADWKGATILPTAEEQEAEALEARERAEGETAEQLAPKADGYHKLESKLKRALNRLEIAKKS